MGRTPRSTKRKSSSGTAAEGGALRSRNKRDNKSTDVSPEDELARLREQTSTKLSQSILSRGPRADLCHLIVTTRAVLATNKEIWDRCKDSLVQRGDKDNNNGGEVEQHRFKRIGSTRVYVSSTNICDQTFFVNIYSKAELTIDSFGNPPDIPPELNSIIPHETADDGIFPSYDLFLEKAFLLHDGVLAEFLAKFKEHLEAVQGYLGRIESWLIEPNACLEFIKDNFGAELDFPPTVGCGESPEKCKDGHSVNAICMRCCRPKGSDSAYDRLKSIQNTRRKNDDDDEVADDSSVESLYEEEHSEEENPEEEEEEEEVDESESEEESESESSSSSHYSRSHLCPHCRIPVSFFEESVYFLATFKKSFEHKQTFDISTDSGKKRLLKFLEFISCKEN